MPHAAAGRVALAVACAALAVAGAPANAQVYKWVDEKGRTHYGEKPPEGTKANEVARPTPPSDPKKTHDPEAWKRKELDLRKERIERERREARDGARTSAERERRCRQARSAMDRIENVQGLYRLDDKGQRVYFTDAERDEERRKARAAIAENC